MTGTAWVGVASGLQAVFRLVLIAILTKHLGAANYGLWGILVATVEILIPIAVTGMKFGYSRTHAGKGHDRETAAAFYAAWSVAFLTSLVFAAALWLGAGGFAQVFMSGNAGGRHMVQVGSLLIVLGTAEVMLREYFGTFLEMRARGAIIVARFALDVAAAALAVLLGWGPVALVAAMTVSRFLPTVCAAVVVLRKQGLVRPDWSVIGPFMRFGLPLQLATVASWTMRFGDRQVLGVLRSEAEAGVFAASSDLSAFILMIVVTLQPGLFPALSALFNRERQDQAVWLFATTLKYFLFVAIPVTLFLSVTAGPVLTLVTTAEFAQRGAQLVPFLVVGTTLLGVAAMARNLLGLVHRTTLAMLIWVGGAVVKIGLTFLLVYWWGLLGAGVSAAVASLLVAVASWVASRRCLAWELDLRAIGKTVVAAGIAAVPAWLIATGDVGRLLASGACFGVLFVALMFALGAVRVAELRRLLETLLRKQADGEPS